MPDNRLLPIGSDECLGRVIAVSPSGIMALIERPALGANGASPLAMGSLVKIPMGNSTLYLMVTGLRARVLDSQDAVTIAPRSELRRHAAILRSGWLSAD